MWSKKHVNSKSTLSSILGVFGSKMEVQNGVFGDERMCLNHCKYCIDLTLWLPEEGLESKWIPNGVPETIFNTFGLHLGSLKSLKCVQRAFRKSIEKTSIFESPKGPQTEGSAAKEAPG